MSDEKNVKMIEQLKAEVDGRSHPAARVFPLLIDTDAKAWDQFYADVGANGLRNPILIDRPVTEAGWLILDGRNRYLACMMLGIEPEFEVVYVRDRDAVTLVISANLLRRHDDVGVRAAQLTQLLEMMKVENFPTPTVPAAAAAAGMSERTLRDAGRLRKKDRKSDPTARISKKLDSAGLSADAFAKAKKVIADHAAKLKDAQAKADAVLTSEQKSAQKSAMQAAKTAGKKGKEAKADVVGMYALKWLVDKGVLPKERLEEYYSSELAGIFRTVRFGTGEAHGRAEMMEFNYYSEQGAIVKANGRYRVDYTKIGDATARLAKELLEQEATGDRARADAWFNKYDKMPADLKASLAAAKDVPVDVDPIFSFPETVD
jgi:ParB-like chromosome segregation protein Spo0J